MTRFFFSLMLLISSVAIISCSNPDTVTTSDSDSVSASQPAVPERRIVSLGGPVTETLFALGVGDQVVGSDAGSLYPPAVHELPRLSYHRVTSAESVISLNPTHLFITEEAGPPTAIDQIRDAGVEIIILPATKSVEQAHELIETMANALEIPDKGAELIESMEQGLEKISAKLTDNESKPSVLFLYSRQGMGAPMVGGRGSGVTEVLKLAGAKNAGANVDFFQPITPEALVEMNPDYILLLEKSLEAIGGREGLHNIPGLSDTTAMKLDQLIVMPDDLLLTYGPRTDKAVRQLAEKLHPDQFPENI